MDSRVRRRGRTRSAGLGAGEEALFAEEEDEVDGSGGEKQRARDGVKHGRFPCCSFSAQRSSSFAVCTRFSGAEGFEGCTRARLLVCCCGCAAWVANLHSFLAKLTRAARETTSAYSTLSTV